MTSPASEAILKRSDAGEHPDAIALAEGVSLSLVYQVLRELRPNRKRKQRDSTSDLPRQIRGLAAQGIEPPRIAKLLQCSRQYVHKKLASS